MAKDYVGIYKITNLINNKIYIGKSVTLNKRKRDFFEFNQKYAGALINRARNKYNDSIYWNYEVLEYCNIEQLSDKEKYYINLYNSNDRNVGYNLTEGGEGVIGFHHSEETKLKLSILTKLRSPEIREKAAEKLRGRKMSNEQRKKISQAEKGRIITEEHKKKIGEANKKIAIKKAIETGNLIIQMDLDGNIVDTFYTLTEASNKTKIPIYNISKCVIGKFKTSGGFIWIRKNNIINNN